MIGLELVAGVALACGPHRGPWPLPPPGVKRCPHVAPSGLICEPAAGGRRLVCELAVDVAARRIARAELVAAVRRP